MNSYLTDSVVTDEDIDLILGHVDEVYEIEEMSPGEILGLAMKAFLYGGGNGATEKAPAPAEPETPVISITPEIVAPAAVETPSHEPTESVAHIEVAEEPISAADIADIIEEQTEQSKTQENEEPVSLVSATATTTDIMVDQTETEPEHLEEIAEAVIPAEPVVETVPPPSSEPVRTEERLALPAYKQIKPIDVKPVHIVVDQKHGKKPATQPNKTETTIQEKAETTEEPLKQTALVVLDTSGEEKKELPSLVKHTKIAEPQPEVEEPATIKVNAEEISDDFEEYDDEEYDFEDDEEYDDEYEDETDGDYNIVEMAMGLFSLSDKPKAKEEQVSVEKPAPRKAERVETIIPLAPAAAEEPETIQESPYEENIELSEIKTESEVAEETIPDYLLTASEKPAESSLPPIMETEFEPQLMPESEEAPAFSGIGVTPTSEEEFANIKSSYDLSEMPSNSIEILEEAGSDLLSTDNGYESYYDFETGTVEKRAKSASSMQDIAVSQEPVKAYVPQAMEETPVTRGGYDEKLSFLYDSEPELDFSNTPLPQPVFTQGVGSDPEFQPVNAIDEMLMLTRDDYSFGSSKEEEPPVSLLPAAPKKITISSLIPDFDDDEEEELPTAAGEKAEEQHIPKATIQKEELTTREESTVAPVSKAAIPEAISEPPATSTETKPATEEDLGADDWYSIMEGGKPSSESVSPPTSNGSAVGYTLKQAPDYKARHFVPERHAAPVKKEDPSAEELAKKGLKKREFFSSTKVSYKQRFSSSTKSPGKICSTCGKGDKANNCILCGKENATVMSRLCSSCASDPKKSNGCVVCGRPNAKIIGKVCDRCKSRAMTCIKCGAKI